MEYRHALREAVWILLTERRVSLLRLKHDLGLNKDEFDSLLTELTDVKGWLQLGSDNLISWVGGDPDNWIVAPRSNSEPAVHEQADMHGEGERRQLTVMFCDLVGSTALASELDPEDMNDLIAAYHDAVTPVLKKSDGFIAKYMGDGILIYFGYPRAREKDAQRAIYAALSIVEAVEKLSRRRSPSIKVRIGIATGTVVVGEVIGEGASQERTVVGDTPNLAARLQDAAPPNGIVISDITHNLAGDEFEIVNLGERELKGFEDPCTIWQVTRELEGNFAFVSSDIREKPPLVGRQEELGLLLRAWQQSKEGSGQVVSVNGEAGIGKSRLVEAILTEANADGAVTVTLRCSPHHTNSALYPIISQLRRVLDWAVEDSDDEKFAKLERVIASYQFPTRDTVPLIAALMSLPVPEGKYPPLNLPALQQRVNTLDTVLAWLLEESELRPTIAVWEDLHWADPSTLELLEMMIEQCPTAPILNVTTARPEFAPNWPGRSHVLPITLSRLERSEVESLIRQATNDKALPKQVVEHIVERGDGVPLYVGELATAILKSDALLETDQGYELAHPLETLSIPATLQDSLLARLDKTPSVREVAQLGAVLGREFGYEIVRSLGAFDENTLNEGLEHLVEEELLYKRGRLPRAKYMFKHALIQDAAYQSLLKRTRQHYHAEVAKLLKGKFPETEETQPEILAHHYTEAGQIEQALDYWLKAGELALKRSANHEAIGHLKRGLALLSGDGSLAERELAMLRLLGTAYMATKGYSAPETIETYQRARKLCSIVQNDSIYPVMFGLWLSILVQADHAESGELCAEMHQLVENSDNAYARFTAHGMSSFAYLHVGDQPKAQRHFLASFDLIRDIPLNDRMSNTLAYGLDIEVASYAYSAWSEWLLGYPDTALERQKLALQALERSEQGYTKSRALYWCSVVHLLRGEWKSVADLTDRAIEIARMHGLTMVEAVCRLLSASAHMELGESGGSKEIEEALEAYMATGARFQTSFHRTLLADAFRREGQIDKGLEVLGKALHMIQETGEKFFLPEVMRLKAELSLELKNPRDDPTEILIEAIEIARTQKARSLELRAATSFARLLGANGQPTKARQCIDPLFSSMDQGHGTRDIRLTKDFLSTL